jgi:hypothetical protein
MNRDKQRDIALRLIKADPEVDPGTIVKHIQWKKRPAPEKLISVGNILRGMGWRK